MEHEDNPHPTLDKKISMGIQVSLRFPKLNSTEIVSQQLSNDENDRKKKKF